MASFYQRGPLLSWDISEFGSVKSFTQQRVDVFQQVLKTEVLSKQTAGAVLQAFSLDGRAALCGHDDIGYFRFFQSFQLFPDALVDGGHIYHRQGNFALFFDCVYQFRDTGCRDNFIPLVTELLWQQLELPAG